MIAKDFSVYYENSKIVKNVNFSLNKGELTVLLGENASGKTTLIKGICNLLKTTGHCSIGLTQIKDLNSRERAKKIAYIPQKSGVAISISVLDVALMGINSQLGIFENPRAEHIINAESILKKVNMYQYKDRNFLTLSEGQKQLVVLARAITQDAELLLFDEADSALDFQNKYILLQKVRDELLLKNKYSLISLHDVNLALKCADRILFMKYGEIIDDIDIKNDCFERIKNAVTSLYENAEIIKHQERYLVV